MEIDAALTTLGHAHCAGLLQPLQAELANTGDVLSCSAALGLVGELSEASSSASVALYALLEEQLSALQQNPDPFLRSQALKVNHTSCVDGPLAMCLRGPSCL